MADSITALITENLRLALHNKPFTYNGVTKNSTAELQRGIRECSNRYPYIEVAGPWVDVTNESNTTMTCELHYAIDWRIVLDDRLVKGAPITTTTKNVASDIIKLIRAGDTFGGYAMVTKIDNWGYYMDAPGNVPEFAVYVELYIKAMVNRDDPYLLG